MNDEPSSRVPTALPAGGPAEPLRAGGWGSGWAARVALPVALLVLALGLHLTTQRMEARASIVGPFVRTVPYRSLEPLLIASNSASAGGARALPIGFSLEQGQTLSSALAELGVSPTEIHEIGLAMRDIVSPRQLRPGGGYAATFDAESRLAAIEMTIEGRGRMQLRREASEWWPSWRPFERRTELKQIRGKLEAALETAIETAGGDAGVAFRMADVLQWDLDFHRDLRRGDRFDVLYELQFLDGRPESVGDILALRYRNGGTWIEAYRFGEDDGYYDYAGRPLQKMFLRSPVLYSRVTSSFSNRRFHPILKRYRPHYGVDFGAATGTPVRVTANGRVRSAGWDGGGGKTVKVVHTNGYMTAYLHLSKFAQGISSGARVTQGQVIGYVGSTGLATAPHLDYRVQHNGRWINPMSLESKPADPVSVDEMESFQRWRDAYRRALESGGPWVAPSGDPPPVIRLAQSEREAEVGVLSAVGR